MAIEYLATMNTLSDIPITVSVEQSAIEPEYDSQPPIARLVGAAISSEVLKIYWLTGFGFHDDLPLKPSSKKGRGGSIKLFNSEQNMNSPQCEILGKYFVHASQPELMMAFFTNSFVDESTIYAIAKNINVASKEALEHEMRERHDITTPIALRSLIKPPRSPHR